MSLHDFCDDAGHGSRNIRSTDHVSICDDALTSIECARIRCERDVVAALQRLHDKLNDALDETGAGNSALDARLTESWRTTLLAVDDLIHDLSADVESAVRAEMEG